MLCPQCQANNLRSAKTCSNCGASLQEGAPPEKAKAPPPPPAMQSAAAPLRLMRSSVDGFFLGECEIKRTATLIGRTEGDWTYPDDPRLSRRHAQIRRLGDRLWLTDLQSTNGTYLRIRRAHRLSPGDFVLMGNQLFRFEASVPTGESEKTLRFGEDRAAAELLLVEATGKVLKRFGLHGPRTVIGRSSVAISFPADTALAEQHAQVLRGPDGYRLEDLHSPRGTFVRLRKEVELRDGDEFLVGSQVFEVRKEGTAS